MWIERDISKAIEENNDPIQVVRGPRQCGKTSLILRLDKNFKELSLDDFSLRALAQQDPNLFLKQFEGQKLFIDEAQYAPELFPAIKRVVDLLKRDASRKKETIFRLTGSNQLLMDKHVKESLAGRASFFDMNTLSVAEILSAKKVSIQEILYKGGWPELHADEGLGPERYLDNFISSYIEKDVVLSAGVQKVREFLKFVRLLAGRIGQLLDSASLANDVGVDSKTIREWISILERMNVISLLQPFSSSLSTRLIKSPKVFFIDTGLACRLQGWTSAEPILTSPQQGSLFENLVFSEIYKLNLNYQLGWQLFHWRSKEKKEIDFIIQKSTNEFLFIEAKVTPQKVKDLNSDAEVKKVFRKKIPNLLLCHQEGEHALGNKIPIALLKNYLLKNFSV